MDFSEKLKHICKAEGISLKEFSDISGIAPDTVRSYSSGRKRPSYEKLVNIVNTPEFKKYQQLLLGTDDWLTFEIDVLVQRMKDEGREEEALSILRYVLERPANEK